MDREKVQHIVRQRGISLSILMSLVILGFFGAFGGILFDQLEKDSSHKQYIQTSPVLTSAPSIGSIPLGENDGIFWFIHITDTQSMWTSQDRIDMFTNFLITSNKTIAPSFYLNTGDIVDSDYHDLFRSNTGQRSFEWNNYSNSLEIAGMTPDIYYDVMGNHDTYGDEGFKWYMNSSMQKTLEFDFVKDFGWGKYHFVGLHTPENIGVQYPFSLFGYLSNEELDWYESVLEENSDARVSVAFGHHPAYEMFEGGVRFNSINRKYGIDLYLVGHGHSDNFEELESGTVSYMTPKLSNSESSYRIVAIKGGEISESIQAYEKWPVGVICSPVDHRNVYGDFNKATLNLVEKIQVLAFDNVSVGSVDWRIAGSDSWNPMSLVSGPLYEAEWDSSLLNGEIHIIEVKIVNSVGEEKIERMEFSSQKVFHFGWKYGIRLIILATIGFIAVPTAIKFNNRWINPSKYGKRNIEKVDSFQKKNISYRILILLFVPLTIAEIWVGKLTAVFGLFYIGNGGLYFYDNNLLFGGISIIFSILIPSLNLSRRKRFWAIPTYFLSILFNCVLIFLYLSRSLYGLLSPGYFLLIILDLLALRRTFFLISDTRAK